MAGQSFADRNGRGSKKNKNLVANLDISSGLARLRKYAIAGTTFEGRLADGTTSGTSETATKNIVDLSTVDQMLLNVISRGSRKAEQIKPYHVDHLLPICHDFFNMLTDTFGDKWKDPAPSDEEPFRRLYLHGWPFALKAIANAYHDCRIEVIGPLSDPISIASKDEHDTTTEAESAYIAAMKEVVVDPPAVSYEELLKRLAAIDWLRYRQHWIAITGSKLDKNGHVKTRMIKDGRGGMIKVVDGKAENTAASISQVTNKLLSDSWIDLTKDLDAKA